MPRLTTKFLQRGVNIAHRARRMSADLSEAFIERYGVTYSDCDCDWLIDALDYGTGSPTITLAEVDYWMTDAGHPPLRAEENEHG